MYPLCNDDNHNPNPNPISLSGPLISHRPFFNSDFNPNSIYEDLQSTSLTHLPSPLIQYDDAVSELTWQQLHDLFIQQQPFTAENSVADQIVNNMEDIPKEDTVHALKQGWPERCARIPEQILRKRTCKKDRHSKITTAQGPRDRRMRLSLDVARKFFDLQDILGFDKASKTVEWLLTQSSSAIKEIMGGLPRIRIGRGSVGANTIMSSTSECEVVSGVDDSNSNENQKASNILKVRSKPSCKKVKVAKLARRTALHKLARESRKVARERARKRTIEKRKLGQAKSCLEARNGDLRQLGSRGRFEAVEESSTHVSKMHPTTHDEGLKEVEELNSHEQRILETRDYAAGDILVITGEWNPSSICDYHQNGETSHGGHQFSDFQFGGKTWEVYGNI